MENMNESTENKLDIISPVILWFAHVLKIACLNTVRWNKKAPAPVALAQIPHLELLSNV